MVISSLTSLCFRPMKRLIEKTVFWGLVTCWRRAGAPTRRWPSLVNATTDGVVRPPSAFGITVGSPPSRVAMHELVVPRSMPIVFATGFAPCLWFGSEENLSRIVAGFALERRAADSNNDGVSEPTFEQELAATLAARKELGPAHDTELIAGFLDRIEHELDAHIDERIAARTPVKRRASAVHPANLALCIPIIAVAGGVGGGLPGVVVAVVALVVVFLYAEAQR